MAETDLTKMTSAELLEALIKDNSLASEIDRLNFWQYFFPWEWSNLLSVQPQFAEKAKEYSHGWVGLLSIKPELANECECWKKFGSFDWCNLLSAQPQFADKCTKYKGWEEFGSANWSKLLTAQPQFADKCNWTEMRANNYDEYDEDEYDDFEYWKAECGKDYSEGWKNLLLEHPRLAEYFTETLWDGFPSWQWDELEAKHPGVFEDKHMLSTLRKLAK